MKFRSTHLQRLLSAEHFSKTLASPNTKCVTEKLDLLHVLGSDEVGNMRFKVLSTCELEALASKGEDLVLDVGHRGEEVSTLESTE